MYDASLPWQIGLALNGLGAIGALIFAGIAIDRLIEGKEKKNQKAILRASIALGLIFVVFAVPAWYIIYVKFGAFDFASIMVLSVLPFFGFAVGGIKGDNITLYCIIAGFLIYAVVKMIMAAIQG